MSRSLRTVSGNSTSALEVSPEAAAAENGGVPVPQPSPGKAKKRSSGKPLLCLAVRKVTRVWAAESSSLLRRIRRGFKKVGAEIRDINGERSLSLPFHEFLLGPPSIVARAGALRHWHSAAAAASIRRPLLFFASIICWSFIGRGNPPISFSLNQARPSYTQHGQGKRGEGGAWAGPGRAPRSKRRPTFAS